VNLLPAIVSSHLSSPAASPAVTAIASPSQQSPVLEQASSTWRPCLCLTELPPPGSRCKLLHLPLATIQPHLQVVGALFRPWLHRPTSTDAMRGLRLGVRVYDASAFPRWRLLRHHRHGPRRLVALGFQAFCVIWSFSEKISVKMDVVII
jgi:hypothetical protein